MVDLVLFGWPFLSSNFILNHYNGTIIVWNCFWFCLWTPKGLLMVQETEYIIIRSTVG